MLGLCFFLNLFPSGHFSVRPGNGNLRTAGKTTGSEAENLQAGSNGFKVSAQKNGDWKSIHSIHNKVFCKNFNHESSQPVTTISVGLLGFLYGVL